MRVMIAEDNALLREGLVLMLTSAGHEVAAVACAEPEILPALRKHWHKPGMRHQMRGIERCVRPRQGMQQSHLQGVLSDRELEASQLPSSQPRGHLHA